MYIYIQSKRNEMKTIDTALAFFASVIKSGEPWTDECQKHYDNAMKELTSHDELTDEDFIINGLFKRIDELEKQLISHSDEYCHHNGKYTLRDDGTCCKCHKPPRPDEVGDVTDEEIEERVKNNPNLSDRHGSAVALALWVRLRMKSK